LQMAFFEIMNIAMHSMKGEIALLLLCMYCLWSLPPSFFLFSVEAPFSWCTWRRARRKGSEVASQDGLWSGWGRPIFQEIEGSGL